MQRLVLLSPAPPLHVKRVDFAQMLLLPSHSPWAAPALAGPPPRGTNAAASPSSNPRTQRRDASAPAPQHSNPHPHPVPMPHGAGPRFQQPAPPRRRITPHGHRAVSNPPNPEAPGACDVGWGLDSRPCPTTEAETGVPGPTGEAGRNLGGSGRGATGGEVVMSVALARALVKAMPRLGWETNGKGDVIKLGRLVANQTPSSHPQCSDAYNYYVI